MTDFVLATSAQQQEWAKNVTKEYIRESGLGPYIGKLGIINVQTELGSNAGNIVHINAIGKLRGPGVRGGAPLVGFEDAMASYSMAVVTDILANAVVINMSDAFKTEMDLAAIVKDRLTGWLAETLRDDSIVALRSVPVLGVGTGTNLEDVYVPFESASTDQLNKFVHANKDRLMFGSKNSNLVDSDFATSLGNVEATDTLSAKMISTLKLKARNTTSSSTFALTPYKLKDGQEWFVLLVDSYGYRDAKNDPLIYNFNKDSRPREKAFEENPILNGSDVIFYDGVIIQHIPELTAHASLNVNQALLCGVQAANLAYSRKVRWTKRNEDNYQTKQGIGLDEIRGVALASVKGTMTGMARIFHASIPDA